MENKHFLDGLKLFVCAGMLLAMTSCKKDLIEISATKNNVPLKGKITSINPGSINHITGMQDYKIGLDTIQNGIKHEDAIATGFAIGGLNYTDGDCINNSDGNLTNKFANGNNCAR